MSPILFTPFRDDNTIDTDLLAGFISESYAGSGLTPADVDTGAVRILRYVVVSDCGRLINPTLVEGQILGGVAHGVGNALMERMSYDESAQPLTTSFADYLLPTAPELPPIEIITHISPSPLNPLGVKGVGECGVIPAGAALMSAIEDALAPFGVRIAETPVTPDRILQLIAAAGRA